MRRLLLGLALTAAASVSAQEAGGFQWQAPKEWKQDSPRPMRAATYLIAPARGDTEGAELAVFYFGQGQGGAVDANVKRWLGQFQRPDGTPADADARTKKETLHGAPLTTVDVKGTYTSAMMAPPTPRPGFRLLGAIVEGPGGAVFFKLTGPQKTVAAAQKAFRSLLESVKHR